MFGPHVLSLLADRTFASGALMQLADRLFDPEALG
jgi:hypothetical protein